MSDLSDWGDWLRIVDFFIKRAVISATTNGNNTIVSAVIDKRIRVMSLYMILTDSTNVRFESGAGGTALTGDMTIRSQAGVPLSLTPANGVYNLEYSPAGHFETNPGDLLNLELSGGDAFGHLTYIEVD